MGEVYRARDVRLGRLVAIKILPPRLASDPVAVARFEQEARAVAALSHPNILAIHDVGRERAGDHDIAFVVMELLDGRTLRDAALRGSLKKTIDYALQIANGLAAAHAKGITHRDLKPENIFLTTDGHVKILDFGLAKLSPPPGASANDATMTAAVKTDAGTVMGTSGYLSPEQAQGGAVDARSDIFSFGAVLYEMTTGTRAFKGKSTIDTLHNILHGQPAPVEDGCPEAPNELKWLIAKCLAKDPDERYQSTPDLVVDLRNVARAVESSPNLPYVGPPLRLPRGDVRRTMTRGLILVAGLIVGFALWSRFSRSAAPAPASTSERVLMQRITSSGNVIDAAISPDGKYVSYVVSEGARQSLWIRQLATSGTLQLVAPAAVAYWGATFSPDSSSIYYVFVSGDEPDRALFRLPVIGGAPRRLVRGLDTFPAFSPDGKQMAYLRVGPEAGTSSLYIADAEGANAHAIATRRAPEFFVPMFFTAPAWSPDGTTIVCPIERRTDTTVGTLVAYAASDGTEIAFPHYEWPAMGQAAWMPNGQGLIVAAGKVDPGRRSTQLWWVSSTGMERRRITSDLLDYRRVSITADGTALVTVAFDATGSLWSAPIDGAGDPRRVTSGKYDGISGLASAPGGRVLYSSIESGTPSIWTLDETTGATTQVTSQVTAAWPAALPDGTSMIFVRGNGAALTRIGLDGQNPRDLPGTTSAIYPTITPDGETMLFVSTVSGIERLWRMPAHGGESSLVVDGMATKPSISPDGKSVAVYYKESSEAPYVLAIVPIGGGKPTATFNVAPSSAFSTVRWTIDSQSVLHNSALNDRANIWRQPIAGGPPQQITHFVDETILGFDVSSDGKRLIISRGNLTRDALLIRDFR